MNLIISLLGHKHNNLFKNKFIYNKKKNKNEFLIDIIIKKFNFCKKIFIIFDSKNSIRLRNTKKIKLVHSNKTSNQIQSILKVKDYIERNEKIIILNPDSLFDINSYDFDSNCDGIIFNIPKADISRNFENKDTFVTNKKNNINKIKLKDNNLKIKNVSAGLYYLKKWSFFLESCSKIKNLNDKKLQVANIFIKLIKNHNISTRSVKNFVCFEDDKKINEYNFWKRYFTINFNLKDNLKKKDIQNIIPSAGEGSRHKSLKYNLPKPLIPISGKTMFERSIESLPNKNNNLFIFKKKTFLKFNLKKKFSSKNKKSLIYLINRKTKGMAITIAKARKLIQLDKPVIISSCDLKCVIDYKKFYDIIEKKNPEAIIFTWSQYPPASESPNSHAYVVDKNLLVNKISEKKPVSLNPDKDSAVTGIFYFKTGRNLIECIEYSIKNKITVNGEYYVATAMTKLLNEKKKIINFKVDQMISWSLPEHLNDYLFWEKIFTNVKN